jgi:anti-sigma-K factor RskA
MSHEQFEEAVALLAVDALTPEERQALEEHLRMGCEECRAAMTEYRAAAGLLPFALAPLEVPFQLKPHLMRTFQLDVGAASTPGSLAPITQEPRQREWRREGRRPRWRRAAMVASVLLLVGIIVYALTIREQLQLEAKQRQQLEAALQGEVARLTTLQDQTTEQEKKLTALRKELADKLGVTRDILTARETEMAQLRTRLSEQDKDMTSMSATLGKRDEITAFLRAPNVKVVPLSGSDEAKAAGGLLWFDPARGKALLYTFNMPALPPGKTYQLWAIQDTPVSAGTFVLDSGNKSRVLIRQIPDLALVKQFAVSLEPEGGQSQPTGPVYLSGQL